MIWRAITIVNMAFIALLSVPSANAGTTKGEIQWGIGGPSALKKDKLYIKAFQVMRQRGLVTYRINVNLTDNQPGASNELADINKSAKVFGVVLKPVLFLQFNWIDNSEVRADVNRAFLYNDAYRRTFAITERFRNDINDWELGNEINLHSRYDNGGKDISPPASWLSDTFDTPRMNDWASVLKGQSDAIDKVNSIYGTHLRKVLNTTGLQFGFLDFMKSKGVNFDVISYHYYEKLGIDMENFPNGNFFNRVNIFEALAKYNIPVIINEINCSEIYDSNYENKSHGMLNDECIKSFDRSIKSIINQKIVDIEGVQVHTFVDLPELKPVAETRFGFMYDLDHPKLALALLAHYTGGFVSDDEMEELRKIGLVK